MNKKAGEAWSVHLIVILALMLIAFGIFFTWLFQDFFTSEDIDDLTCKNSVHARSINLDSNLAKKQIIEKFPFTCETHNEDINTNSGDKAMAEIADIMANCHNTYGEGEKILYSNKWMFEFLTENRCFICARINIDDVDSDRLNLAEFLINEDFIGRGEKETYFDYLYDNLKGDLKFNDEGDLFRDIPDFHKKKGELLSEYVFVPGDGDLFVAYVYHISTVLELHEMETRVYQKTSEEKGPGVKFDCEIETIGA